MDGTPLTQLGRYRILAELGRGAMGVVYKAEDSQLNRSVAIKTVRMSADAEERAEYEARFYQEAKAAGGLNHPNIITIHDIGREGDVLFMAMELLEGVDLRGLMSRERLPLALALDIAAQAADGLAFAHARGVIHRDIKPGNIMVVRGEHAKIMDFGIARTRLSDVKTQAGAMLGSPKYMSPEQVNGERADHRSDIFSLGVTLYEMVTGVAPFSAPDFPQLMYAIASAAPQAPSVLDPALPSTLDLIAAKALEKKPDARYQNAAELAGDLRACRAHLDEAGLAARAAQDPAMPPQLEAASTTIPLADLARTVVITDGAKTEQLTLAALPSTPFFRLSISRRFDSSAAMARLAASPSPGIDPGKATPLKRILRDPQQRALIAAIAAAALCALVIAFI